MSRIATLTMNPAVDVTTAVDQVIPNRKLRCSEAKREPGGGGINVARAIHRLGGDATAIFLSGGPTGERLARQIEDEGVTPSPINIAHESRETLNVTERSTGSQFRFIMEGPEIAEPEWQAVLSKISSLDPAPEYLVASGSLPPGVPPDFYGRLSRLAAERGTHLIVDTSGAPLQHAVGPGTLLLKPNIHEFRQLTGAGDATGGFSDFFLEGAARALVSAGRSRAVLLSIGAGGAILAWEGGVKRIVAPTVKVESRVGAGDSTVAGTVLALSRGMPIDQAAVFGIAAGTAAVMTPGTELCTREDTERLYEQMSGSGTKANR
ncbi:MAG TPA: 1-phosphofructokinase family hexose kinase [Thermoanaerobaculia bacterium]